MNKVKVILSGIGILITIYLILSHADTVTDLFNSLMSNVTSAIQTLQRG